MVQLAGLFALTALLYAMVGFGGGSTYNALLVLHGTDYRILPSIALLCNIIVVAGGSWRFWRAGHVSVARILPWIVISVPAAWLGGRIMVSEVVFIGVLGGSLLVAGLQLAFESKRAVEADAIRPVSRPVSYGVGGGIGFLSGLVGIGGGIFLAPVLYLLRWGSPREIAGTASVFILVNSLAGLAGQMMKLESSFGVASACEMLQAYWPVFPAVLIAGQIGSRLGSARIPPLAVKRLTAALILYVALRLIWRWFGLIA
ncbi:sulfite exporter TauE/SafE family protein [Parasphingopyxis marina]|uniref:Probable membrane transporter protein n=1 Tax=Parasphingopyxis marina TaxID=2761622 RepID=A0A842I0E2_9SPHN|nr:sulfite exporter TauE/SafE family protein [Parasphingopyxis marina]MBC2778141.1 sulfite exporter TauE/SafE family protein [Parasphingopyxis marina]